MRRLGAPDSYGVVVLMILTTYLLALVAAGRWTGTALLVAQTGTVWRVLHTSRAHRRLVLCSLATPCRTARTGTYPGAHDRTTSPPWGR